MTLTFRALLLGWLACLASVVALRGEPAPDAGEIVSSFAFLGDNEVDKAEATPGEGSCANVAQLRQTLKDISTLQPRPAYLFLTGDMVENEADDHGETLAERLAAWTNLYRQACGEFGLNVPLVPVPGNHELMKILFLDGKPREVINAATYPVWLKWLERDGFGQFGGNGPTSVLPNLDRLAENNRRLTYSFEDAAGNHFILINTFTRNNQPESPRGWIPYHWIAEDARKAEANPRVRHIFAFGHLPIRIGGRPFDRQGDNSIFNSDSQPLAQQLQESFGRLTKFRGYFCGHLHLWDCSRLPGTNDVWQVIGGIGGSRLIQRSAGAWQAPFFFGFTVVRIHRDGRVGVVCYSRPVAEPYYSTAPQPPAKPHPEIFLQREGKSGAAQDQP